MSQKSSAVNPWNHILHRKKELMIRDPVGQRYMACLRRLLLETPNRRDENKLVRQRFELEDELKKKYHVESIYVWDRPRWKALSLKGTPSEWLVENGWHPAGLQAPFSVRTNWCLPGQMKLVWDKDKRCATIITPLDLSSPPHGEDPTMTVTINLAEMKSWNLERLCNDIKNHIRTALRSLPNSRHQDPASLSFLRTIRERTFLQDLHRYDLHMSAGLSFRMIALLERLEERGTTRDEAARSRPVGFTVPGESTVREAVGRIYRAIHRKPYRAPRRRLDSPAAGVGV